MPEDILRSLIIAFSMYSRIPMPRCDWNEKSMKFAMCFFPLVGGVIGILESLWFHLAEYAGFGTLFRSAVMTVLPLLITGGIHMDGFLDTVDAVSSWRTREERLRILKDPHAGAFAVIGGAACILLFCGAASEISAETLPAFCLCFVVSRALSGLSVVHMKSANPSGTAAAFGAGAQKNVVTAVLILMLTVSGIAAALAGVSAALPAGAGIFLGYLVFYLVSVKYFGGITGDLAGFLVTVTELFAAVSLAIAGRI